MRARRNTSYGGTLARERARRAVVYQKDILFLLPINLLCNGICGSHAPQSRTESRGGRRICWLSSGRESHLDRVYCARVALEHILAIECPTLLLAVSHILRRRLRGEQKKATSDKNACTHLLCTSAVRSGVLPLRARSAPSLAAFLGLSPTASTRSRPGSRLCRPPA